MPKINLPRGWSESNVRALYELDTGEAKSGKSASVGDLNAFIKLRETSFEKGPASFPGVTHLDTGRQLPPKFGDSRGSLVDGKRKSGTGGPPPVPSGLSSNSVKLSKFQGALATFQTSRGTTMMKQAQARLTRVEASLAKMDSSSSPKLKRQRVRQAVELLKAARSCCTHARSCAERGGEVSLDAVSALEGRIGKLAGAFREKGGAKPKVNPEVRKAEATMVEQPAPTLPDEGGDKRVGGDGISEPSKPAPSLEVREKRKPVSQPKAKRPVISTRQHRITGTQLRELKDLFVLKLNQADKAHAQQKRAKELVGSASSRTELVAAQREVRQAKGLAYRAKGELQEVSYSLVLTWSALQGRIDGIEHKEFVRLRGQIQEAEALCRGWEDELAGAFEDLRARIVDIDRREMSDQFFTDGTEDGRLMAEMTDELRLEAKGDPVTEMLERRLQALKGDQPSEAELIRRLNALN